MDLRIQTLRGVLVLGVCCAIFQGSAGLAEEGGTTPVDEGAAAAGSSQSESLFIREGQEVVAHTFVGTPEAVHGEVTIFRTDKSRIVETLLYSRVLKRVVAEIAHRESEAWPTGTPRAVDSLAYVEALGRAQKRVWWLASRRPQSRDRLQEMSIDFEIRENSANLSVFAVRTREESGDRRRVVQRDLLETLAVSRDYALRSQRLIVSDAFGVDEATAVTLLERPVSK